MANFSLNIADLEYFLMILVRIASFMFTAPFFSTSGVPRRTKVGFSVVVAFMLYFTLPSGNLQYSTVIQYGAIVVKEAVVGLSIGYAANICSSIVLFAGKVIDMEIGLSMATMFDPVTRENASISGAFYNYFVLILMVVTDMHHFILRAVVDTYTLIPINGMVIDFDHMFTSVVKFFTDYIVIGFRIALPIFACILILNVVLGILAKVAPQMNMFAVGMQLKLLVGFAVMFLTISLLPSVANFIFEEMKVMIVSVVEGLY